MTPLPFEPESEETALARFPAALKPEYEFFALLAGEIPTLPCFDRKHVFDFPCGIRMIANVMFSGFVEMPRMLHLSFGFFPEAMVSGVDPTLVSKRIADLSKLFAGERELCQAFLSPKGLPNFYFRM